MTAWTLIISLIKAAKIGYLLGEIRDKHENIKQCIDYIQVFENAITYNYTLFYDTKFPKCSL